MKTAVDLAALRIEPSGTQAPRRPVAFRLLGIAMVLLVLLVAATFAWPLLRPVRTVPTARIRASTQEAAAMASVEAVGWVEADPFPVIVRPLVAGRVRELLVLENDAVTAGSSILARLDSASLQAAHDRARAAEAHVTRLWREAEARLELAEHRRRQNAQRRTELVQARIALLDKQQKLARMTGAEQRARAVASGAEAALAAQRELRAAGGSNAVALARAEADAAAAAAEAAAAAAELQAVVLDVAAAEQQLALAAELERDPADLVAEAGVARAAVDTARAALDLAAAELQTAARELAWTEVVAPVSGSVLRLLASPGDTVGPDGSGIVALYDPARLRARIDVPLASVGGVFAGQRVELTSEVTGRRVVAGEVQRLQPESDLLKNTLQVKVALLEPPSLWKPETLVRARFLAERNAGQAAAATVFFVPRAALRDGRVFVIDPAARRARAILVEVLAQDGDEAMVRGALSPTQRAILAAVADGEAVAEERR